METVMVLLLGLCELAPAQVDAGIPHPVEQDAGLPPQPARPSYSTVVTAARTAVLDRTGDVTAVDGQSLRNSVRASVLESLASQSADIHVSARGALHGVANGASGGIHIRGLGGSPNTQVLMVEDGVPDYQGIFGHPLPDAYVPVLLQEAQVIKGGDSVMYGTNALGGVVVLQNRWRNAPGFEVHNDLSVGSFSTMRESFSLLGRVGALDLAAGLQAQETQGHRAGAGGGSRVGLAAVRFKLGPAVRITLRNKVFNVRGADPGTVSHPHDNHWFDVWRYTGSAQAALSAGAMKFSLTEYLNVGWHRLHDGFASWDGVAGAAAQAEWRVLPNLQLVGGASTERVSGTVENWSQGAPQETHRQQSVALFNQLTVRPFQRVTLVFGTREHVSSTYGPMFLYKGGVRWDVLGGLFVRTRVARNFRQPTLRELYLPYPTANPHLKPEVATNWDAGLGYQGQHLDISASLYRTSATNLIKYFGTWPSAEVVNIHRLTTWGVEAHAALKRVGPLSAMVGANWQRVGRYTRENPEAKVNGSVEAEQGFGAHTVAGSLSGEWVHGLYMANYGRQRIPDVFVADASLRYRYAPVDAAFTVEPYLHLRNITDRRYAYLDGYTMPGFHLLAGVRLDL